MIQFMTFWSQWFGRIYFIILTIKALPILTAEDAGRTVNLTPGTNVVTDSKALSLNSKIYVKIECNSNEKMKLQIIYSLWHVNCLYDSEEKNSYLLENNNQLETDSETRKLLIHEELTVMCPDHMIALEAPENNAAVTKFRVDSNINATLGASTGNQELSQDFANVDLTNTITSSKAEHHIIRTSKPLYTVVEDGIYVLVVKTEPTNQEYSAVVHIEIIGPYGYLLAIEYPLFLFYGLMCIVYVFFGLIWLLVSFMQWRDLLRIQFWIGGVILMGMLEKAFFYAHYHSLNNKGILMPGAELSAEFVSCAKRTLARMLVIIMSLGFGIVKPRLGPMLHRVVAVGTLYFILASVESYLRVMHANKTKRNDLLVANIPLAFIDSGICYWIFTSLVQTTRTLRLRRNMVKLTLYRHFTNTLIFAVITSTAFMFYSMQNNKKEYCTPGWHFTWFETAFWHILFSVLLFVIMVLWRPTNNNQRYAFTPLLDNPEDEDDEEDQFVADAFGVKMRISNGFKTSPNNIKNTTNEEDDLRWVEDNIPSAISESTLPTLDSDEEVLNTKFEVSKMQ